MDAIAKDGQLNVNNHIAPSIFDRQWVGTANSSCASQSRDTGLRSQNCDRENNWIDPPSDQAQRERQRANRERRAQELATERAERAELTLQPGEGTGTRAS